MNTKKEKVLAYMEKDIPAGVYQVRNKVNGKLFINASPNLDGAWNKDVFTLRLGSHISKELQNDWNQLGEAAFEYEVLEVLKRKAGERNLSKDERDQLKKLEEKWRSQLSQQSLYMKFK